MPGPDTPPWAELAATAYRQAAARDVHAAAATIQRLVDQHGATTLPDVLMAWIDTSAAHAGIPTGRPAAIRFIDGPTGQRVENTNEMDPDVAWCVRLYNARIAGEAELCDALLVEADDANAAAPGVWSRRVINLLMMCSRARIAGWTTAGTGGQR